MTYFERDKLDNHISYSIHVVEQIGNEQFNRGKLCNSGYQITKDKADYFCFHDVDYLPIWADYTYSECPTHLIWHGVLDHYQYPDFFGGVTLFNKGDFFKINGFGNEYWGWGAEDEELRERCRLIGLSLARRKGTFSPLPHDHSGFNADGTLKPSAQKNRSKFQQRRQDLASIRRDDGLSTLEYELENTSNITISGKKCENVFLHQVAI